MREITSVSPHTPAQLRIALGALFLSLLAFCLFSPRCTAYAYSPELIDLLKGSKIYAQNSQKTFLGLIDSEFYVDSIFNQFGSYGDKISSNSIWNKIGTFGDEISSYSPYNSYTNSPPVIVKNGTVIGFLTVNTSIEARLSPYDLKKMKGAFQ